MRLAKILTITALMLLSATWLQAQNRTVRGTVLDSSQLPLPGVGVLVEGTTNGTVSGADGSFSLKVPSKDVVLVFSSLGYQSKSVPVPASQEVVNVTLEDDAIKEYSYPAVICDDEGCLHIAYTWRRYRIKYVKVQL